MRKSKVKGPYEILFSLAIAGGLAGASGPDASGRPAST
jgi:hypothetical protein